MMMSVERALGGLDVSRETLGRLELFANLVRKWNPAVNLVGRSTVADLWARHIVDSAQIFEIAPADARSWADLGSGGGFPGIVVACLARQFRDGMTVTLVESDQRKAAFLIMAAKELGLDISVRTERIELLQPLGVDVVSARALAPLEKLCAYAFRHMAAAGCAIFPKGARAEEEIAQARRTWMFDLTCFPSLTDPEAQILRIKGLRHA